jgi:hypothetical protein
MGAGSCFAYGVSGALKMRMLVGFKKKTKKTKKRWMKGRA